MELVFAGAYLIGWVAAILILRHRAGINTWGRIQVFGKEGFGLAWVTMCAVCALFWPITLIVWLVRGRPEPRVVFNGKAAGRRRVLESGRSGNGL